VEGERHAEELHYCFASCASHRGLYCVTVYVYVCVYVSVRVYVRVRVWVHMCQFVRPVLCIGCRLPILFVKMVFLRF